MVHRPHTLHRKTAARRRYPHSSHLSHRTAEATGLTATQRVSRAPSVELRQKSQTRRNGLGKLQVRALLRVWDMTPRIPSRPSQSQTGKCHSTCAFPTRPRCLFAAALLVPGKGITIGIPPGGWATCRLGATVSPTASSWPFVPTPRQAVGSVHEPARAPDRVTQWVSNAYPWHQ